MTREEEIFAAALVLSGEARRAYLTQACGDDHALRENVEVLLEAHASSEDFMAASPSSGLFAAVEPQPGERIGPYVIVRKIGEGGCGLVFLAEQEQPIRRRVALKVIKPGMDSKQVIARFEAERQALAQMEHPDIARVFEAGATPAGRPYFAMEYVDGVPITRFCDETNLPLAARLELFERICLALQHAHQKGIVHRDVKPSNVLVALHDGRPAPKIIDFGIAKATQARLTDATQLTGFEQFLGTPAYMSPEQAERRDLDIDTRSDIYSLGVLLYELLTGQPPFDPKSLVRAGVEEIRRIIREVDPPRPSAVVATLSGSDRNTVAQHRRLDAVRLTRTLRGELDWVVMRCLEKERERRYPTAQELAEELRRYRNSEPVTARPPSGFYRTRKFAVRHRLVCASAGGIAAALVLGVVFSLREARRALRAEQAAERRQEQAEALFTFMLGDFRTELQKAGKLVLLDNVGEQALRHFASLDPADLTDAALAGHAKALYQIGAVRMEQVRYPQAQVAFSLSYDRSAALTARQPKNVDALFERAQAEFWLGAIARKRGDYPASRAWLLRYRDSAIALQAQEGKTIRARKEVNSGHFNLAVVEYDHGNYAAARSGFLAQRAATEDMLRETPGDLALRFRLADIISWLGFASEREGRFAEAEQSHTEMTAILEALIVAEPTNTKWRYKLAEGLLFTAINRQLLGQTSRARAALVRSQGLLEQLCSQDPKNLHWQAAAQNVALNRAIAMLAAKDKVGALALVARARARLEGIVAGEASTRVYNSLLAQAWLMEARLLAEMPDTDAKAAVERARTLAESILQDGRVDTVTATTYASVRVLEGQLALSSLQPESARRHWEEAWTALRPRITDSNYWRLLEPAALALTLSGRTEEARPFLERLRQIGYHASDPSVAAALNLPLSSVSPP